MWLQPLSYFGDAGGRVGLVRSRSRPMVGMDERPNPFSFRQRRTSLLLPIQFWVGPTDFAASIAASIRDLIDAAWWLSDSIGWICLAMVTPAAVIPRAPLQRAFVSGQRLKTHHDFGVSSTGYY